jgi:hypothetical protein
MARGLGMRPILRLPHKQASHALLHAALHIPLLVKQRPQLIPRLRVCTTSSSPSVTLRNPPPPFLSHAKALRVGKLLPKIRHISFCATRSKLHKTLYPKRYIYFCASRSNRNCCLDRHTQDTAPTRIHYFQDHSFNTRCNLDPSIQAALEEDSTGGP